MPSRLIYLRPGSLVQDSCVIERSIWAVCGGGKAEGRQRERISEVCNRR